MPRDPIRSITLRVPLSIREEIKSLARDDGQSVNQWLIDCLEPHLENLPKRELGPSDSNRHKEGRKTRVMHLRVPGFWTPAIHEACRLEKKRLPELVASAIVAGSAKNRPSFSSPLPCKNKRGYLQPSTEEWETHVLKSDLEILRDIPLAVRSNKTLVRHLLIKYLYEEHQFVFVLPKKDFHAYGRKEEGRGVMPCHTK